MNSNCKCGHTKDEHWYSGFVCNTCGCTLYQKAINNDFDALTQALVLAVTAPTDEQSHRATALAEQIAAGMTEIDVQRARKAAEAEPAAE